MEFLGIGPAELVFIVIIALIILGPRDMQKAGRTLGKWMRRVVTSDGWRLFQQTSREIQTLPNRLMREAALDELKEMQKDIREPLDGLQRDLRQPFDMNSPRTPNQPAPGAPQASQPAESRPALPSAPDNKILPPANTPPSPEPPADDKDKNV
jgi:sec-independent protein translocase protein TatB